MVKIYLPVSDTLTVLFEILTLMKCWIGFELAQLTKWKTFRNNQVVKSVRVINVF